MASSGLVTTMMMALGERCGRLLGGRLDDFVVGQQKVVAAHAGLAREAGGDDDDVGIGGGRVVVGAGDRDVVAFDGAGLQQVEAFTLRDAFDDVDEHDVAQFFFGGPDGTIRADVTGADDGNFVSHRGSHSISPRLSRKLPEKTQRRPAWAGRLRFSAGRSGRGSSPSPTPSQSPARTCLVRPMKHRPRPPRAVRRSIRTSGRPGSPST